jgi:hypothetical protein
MSIYTMVLIRAARVLIALALILRSQSLYAQAGPVSQPANNVASQGKILEDIVSTNAQVRLDAAFQIENQREQVMDNLLVILHSPIPDDRKMDAAIILGLNQSYGAIPYLVNHLEWQDNLMADHAAWTAYMGNVDKPPRTNYIVPPGERTVADMVRVRPVSGPLSHMGAKAIPALLDKISQSDNELIIGECDNICVQIEGDGIVAAEVTQLRLQDRLQKETDSKKKERFQTAIDILKKGWLKK